MSLAAGLPTFPVTAVLPELMASLERSNRAILSAPPGAGKTTIVPLALLEAPWRKGGRIIVLEPRRLAARAAANRMAALLGEEPGGQVGYRMRLETRVGKDTVIEVVTEGVFARMVLDNPDLSGIAAILFDEFHERSLDADLGLALALDVQAGLREDLRILVMSATLDVDRISALLVDAPVIASQGRSFPVTISHVDRPGTERIEETMTRTILSALAEETGSILAFLPGQGEIGRVAERLAGRVPADVSVVPLFGNLDRRQQDEAIRPAPAGRRKVVLATSIAETSITIDGVTIVIDSGLQRRPVHEAATGISRLETVKVSRAGADQRAGRAGRTAPGRAIRLWHEGQTAALAAFNPPEILSTDLGQLMLDLAAWGVDGPDKLRFIDQPPAPAIIEARRLLVSLGALDARHRLTDKGTRMRGLGLPPRLAAMVIAAAERGSARRAADVTVLLTEQGLGGSSIDLEDRLSRFRADRGDRAAKARALAETIARRAGQSGPDRDPALPGDLLLHAFPDRIALNRGGRGRFVMASGRGAEIDPVERLAGAGLIVIADLTGKAGGHRVLSAAETSRAAVDSALPDAIRTDDEVWFDEASGQVRARRITRLGAIVLDESPLPRPRGEAAARMLAEGLRQRGLAGLAFSKAGDQLRDRIGFLNRTIGDPWPDMSDDALLARLEDWFVPFQGDTPGLSAVSAQSLAEGLMSLVPHGMARELDRLAPTHYLAPTGQRHPIRYDGDEPVLAIRVQELFGQTTHPSIGGGRIPLVLELLSPAHRPIQTTRDLPGFWAGSWKDVRADMRGRYPKHPWPDNPAEAMPTARAKPRGS